MTHFMPMCAGVVAVAAGTFALTFPAHTENIANHCRALLGLGTNTVEVDADARRFDEIISDLASLDNLPRLELASNAHIPHFTVDPEKRPAPVIKQTAPQRQRSTSVLQIRRSVASQPDGIYARSRVGSRNGDSKSIFEQSRFYKRHGSAFDNIRTPGRYLR